MKLSISEKGLQFLEEERRHQEINLNREDTIKSDNSLYTDSRLSTNRKSNFNKRDSNNSILPKLELKKRVSKAFSKAIKQSVSPSFFKSKRRGFNYYTNPYYVNKEHLKTEPVKSGNYMIFKDSLDSLQTRNDFLRRKIGKIVTSARKKKKLNGIEKKIKTTGLNRSLTSRTLKTNVSLPFFNNRNSHLKSQDEIISFNRSVQFFKKCQKKQKINYKEFNSEIREIEKMKKLEISHKNSNKNFNLRMKEVKKAHRKLINEMYSSNKGFRLAKQLRKADEDFNKIFHKNKREEASIQQVFIVGDLSGGQNEKHQHSIGNVKFDWIDKEEVKSITNELPDVFRDEKMQNIKRSKKSIKEKKKGKEVSFMLKKANKTAKSHSFRTPGYVSKMNQKLGRFKSVGIFERNKLDYSSDFGSSRVI